MFRIRAGVLFSLCAISVSSPAWSQSPQDKPPSGGPTIAPTDQSGAQREFEDLKIFCLGEILDKNIDFCDGEIARRLFKLLGRDYPTRTRQDGIWLRRVSAGKNPNMVCWTRNDNNGTDPIVSMIYMCQKSVEKG
jgi:hypothetical protein